MADARLAPDAERRLLVALVYAALTAHPTTGALPPLERAKLALAQADGLLAVLNSEWLTGQKP